MHALVDDSTIDDVLLTLRLAALFTPGRELTADEVASTCWISRPPSCFQMSPKGAAEALKELVKDGYAVARRTRKNLYKLDPADRRPALPNGYRYARRTHAVDRSTYEVVVTPLWGSGSRLWLPVEGDSVEVSPVFKVTWQYQSHPGVRPLTRSQALYWVSTLTCHGWVSTGERVRCALSNAEGLRQLAHFAHAVETRAAAVVEDRRAVEVAVERAEKERRIASLIAYSRA